MKRLYKARLAAVILFALMVGLNVMAHHGWADFDRSKRVEIMGIIVESKYENPHTFVRVKVGQDEWTVELAAVPRMKRNGITAEMIKPGTRITLVGHPHKKKAHEMKATHITLNGKTYELTL
jgi:tRNA(Ile2) C34 agmatinyltransferase TiaS